MKKIGILLVNLGTPASPHPKDVRHYLNEFLMDGRVIDKPWLTRFFLVRGLIVPFRYKSSAKAYQQIWTKEGSPLLVHGENLRRDLQQELGEDFIVEIGMCYQNPSLKKALDTLLKKEVSRLLVLPLYPHYASATTGSVHQKVMGILSKQQLIPEVTFVDHFFDHPGLINAFCEVAKKHSLSTFDHFLFSFHGLPERQLTKVDCHGRCLASNTCCKTVTQYNRSCYSAQCHATATAIVKALEIPQKSYSISFQSRLGKEPWLSPYTSKTITTLAKEKKNKILVFCPSFVCDCLETLYEIGIEYSHEFKAAGGENLTLVEGLNNHPSWIQGIKNIILDRLPHQYQQYK